MPGLNISHFISRPAAWCKASVISLTYAFSQCCTDLCIVFPCACPSPWQPLRAFPCRPAYCVFAFSAALCMMLINLSIIRQTIATPPLQIAVSVLSYQQHFKWPTWYCYDADSSTAQRGEISEHSHCCFKTFDPSGPGWSPWKEWDRVSALNGRKIVPKQTVKKKNRQRPICLY